MSVNIYDMNYYFKIIIILFLFGCKPIYISKKDKESYNAINETIYEITKTKKGAEIYLFEKPIPINTMLDKNFFTKTYLKEVYGNGGVLGVDSRKISNLIKEIDLNTVATEKIDKAQRWDSSQFRFPYRFLKKNIKNSIPKHKQNNLSMPLFVGNNYFFIYTDYFCGSECGQGSVVIFKKINGQWEHYERLPVWIS